MLIVVCYFQKFFSFWNMQLFFYYFFLIEICFFRGREEILQIWEVQKVIGFKRQFISFLKVVGSFFVERIFYWNCLKLYRDFQRYIFFVLVFMVLQSFFVIQWFFGYFFLYEKFKKKNLFSLLSYVWMKLFIWLLFVFIQSNMMFV